ncbi:MAG: CvpA family protein [Sphingomonadaceae bacterium]|uniref:CvpA family protein n=1 Tax=Thermaurantiacus sp. TaxID=2820283 RepID=UPI00298F1D5D|nr:CvpA family protein [Thermaurantiacus sp.]MCS6987127.1 CvpA family protein [Sphingomonadaceae bacterium]MDW8415839.1 CvpA family protein [Thermaurantiacus sp.]
MLDTLTGFDWVVLAIVGLFLAIGVARGLVAETLSLAAWVAAALAVRLFHEPVTRWLEPRTGGEASAAVLAFLCLFFGALLAGRLVAAFAGRAARASTVGPLDRLAGGAFGALKGLLLATVVFMTLRFTTGFFEPGRRSPDWLMTSVSAPFLDYAGRQLVHWLEEATEPQLPALPEGHPPIGPFGGPFAAPDAAPLPEPGYPPEDNRKLEELIAKGEAIEL